MDVQIGLDIFGEALNQNQEKMSVNSEGVIQSVPSDFNAFRNRVLKQVVILGYHPEFVSYVIEINNPQFPPEMTYKEAVMLLMHKCEEMTKHYMFQVNEEQKSAIERVITPKLKPFFWLKNQDGVQFKPIYSQEQLTEENKSLQQQQQIEKVQCMICFDDIPVIKMDTVAPCAHRFCKDCILNYLEESIKNGNVLHVKCPMEGCTEEYTEELIRENVSFIQWMTFKKFKRRAIISQNPNVRWCPRPDCENYVIGGIFAGKLKCLCGQGICFDCGDKYHPGVICKNALNELYQQAIKKYGIHPCPICRVPVQKIDGCNLMTCYNCNKKFCWICMGRQSQFHYCFWNLIGCIIPDGQHKKTDPWRYPLLCRIIAFFLKLIVLPFFLIGFTVFFPYYVYTFFYGEHRIQNMNPVKRVFAYLGIFLMGIILYPISLAIELIPLPCILLYYECKERYG